jgi:hypothetical protein
MKWTAALAVALLSPAVANARSGSVSSSTATLDFLYAWPSQAAGIPALDRYFRAQAAKALRTERVNAADDREAAGQNHFPFRKHAFSMRWSVLGSSPRLLSLQGDLAWDSGGAHPNTGTQALLWDRKLNRQLKVDALFARRADFARLTRTSFCTKLDAERLKRRQGEKLGGEFDQCPKFGDLAIAPVGKKRNGRFQAIQFTASPYVAGPYVEGDYQISLPVTPKLVAALKREYRSSFEAHRQ